MQITYSNSVVLEYDDTIMVGQLISAYHKGYHVVTRIEFREQDDQPGKAASPILHYVKVLDDAGKPSKALKNSCDASFCRKITLEIARQLQDEAAQRAYRRLGAMTKYL